MAAATDDHSPSLAPDAPRSRQALSVLIVSTLAFTVCFMVWMMFGVITSRSRRRWA